MRIRVWKEMEMDLGGYALQMQIAMQIADVAAAFSGNTFTARSAFMF
jgi:hypothetical protein